MERCRLLAGVGWAASGAVGDALRASGNRSFRRAIESGMSRNDARGTAPREPGAVDIVGDSPPLRTVRERVARVAPTGSTVLITGGLGVGKELVARAIHHGSRRAALPFVALSGGAPPPAIPDPDAGRGGRPGRAAAAEPGTLFLADVGEMGAAAQAALLRCLKERRFRRAGGVGEGTEEKIAAARLVVATTRDLAGMVEDGEFRRDLFYCINVFTIHVPPLAARREDIVPLARHFVERFARETGRDLRGLSPAAERVLEAHAWPGNVSELENVVERAAVLEGSDRVQAESLELDEAPRADRRLQSPRRGGSDAAGQERGPAEPLPESGFVLEDHVRSIERDYLERALRQTGGVKVRAAGLLGMSFRSFRYYAKKYDLG